MFSPCRKAGSFLEFRGVIFGFHGPDARDTALPADTVCLTPPKGAAGSDIRPRLMPSMPVSMRLPTLIARLRSLVNM